MTVLPFRARRSSRDDGGSAALGEQSVEGGAAVPVQGTFRSPIGGRGRFVGSFRLESCTGDGPTAAVGVFAGVLRDAEDALVGVAARRQSTPARASRERGAAVVVLHPVSVDLLGLQVRLDPVVVPLPAPGATPTAAQAQDHLPRQPRVRTRVRP